jgi:hypothetical protein
MSIFQKIKAFFGIGLMDVVLDVPNTTFRAGDTAIVGTIRMTAKSDQRIKEVDLQMEEKWSKGSGDEKTEKTFSLGKKVWKEAFDMKAGETKEIPFELEFSYEKSLEDRLKEKGGVIGGLGAAAKFLSSEKSNFWLTATVDLESATFDPNAVLELKRMDK